MPTKHRFSGLFPGLILISVGGGLLARELGYLSPQVRLLDFWPLLIVVLGISSLLHRRRFLGALFSLAFIVMGGLLLAGNLGLMTFPVARLWPALLVVLGLSFLLRGFRAQGQNAPARQLPSEGESSRSPAWSAADCGPQTSGEERMSRQFNFSGAQLRIESQAWRGGEIGVTAGGIELDLRNARLVPEGAQLEVRILMGGVDLRVPENWQVQCEVTPLFGGVDDTTLSTQGAVNAPRLRVVGAVTLGGINIRN